jgi:hypothetical protein
MSKRFFLLTVLTLTAVLTVAFTPSAQSVDPWLGTWKLNLTKSKFVLGPPPTSLTLKWELSERKLKFTSSGANAQGQATHDEWVGKFDGKDYALSGAPTANTTRAYKRIDDRTYEFVTKVDGKVTGTTRVVVSRDTMRATTTGKDALGRTIHNLLVWDRQ